MATGDQNDIAGRIMATLPPWFATTTGNIGAVIQGAAAALALAYSLLTYAAQQTRIKTATDGWLDMIAADFFGGSLLRVSGQSDSSFRARILIAMFRERGTRLALSKVLVDLTGRTPRIFEPARPADAGGYSTGGVGYGAAGGYGSLQHPSQVFVMAYRPIGGGVADADIYAAVNSVKPAGAIAWVRILD